MIRLNDLKAQHESIRSELNEAIDKVFSSSQFIGGEERNKFEKNFAEYVGNKYCVGTSNGSTALLTTLKCLGVGAGDEVIVPVNTFISTASAVTFCGAKPVFVDVNESDFLINVDLIEGKITDKTKAIIPVHLHGAVCDMSRILEITKKHNLVIVEDCAQAHGAEYDGIKVPVSGIGCFSFFPAKNMGALGDSGCIVADDLEFSKKCSQFVNHGRSEKYLHETLGFNFRMNNLQAAVLNVKLGHLDSWNAEKRELLDNYDKELGDSVKIPVNQKGRVHHLYVIRHNKRDELQRHLKDLEIETGIHYPVPLHLQPVFSYLGHKKGDFPVAEKLAEDSLSIPFYPGLSSDDQTKITDEIRNFLLSSN